MTRMSEETRRKMAESRSGSKHYKFQGYFYMIDLETNEKWKFTTTGECANFAKDTLGLTLCNATVYRKLNKKVEPLIYKDRYIFEWEQSK